MGEQEPPKLEGEPCAHERAFVAALERLCIGHVAAAYNAGRAWALAERARAERAEAALAHAEAMKKNWGQP